MHPPGTILALRAPIGTDEKPYPYDRVVVIGTSPVQHLTEAKWKGQDATSIVIQPVDSFGGNVDKPLGEINELYEVESYPETNQVATPVTPESQKINPQSPEQLLTQAQAASEVARARKRAESLKNNDKSPEQSLREKAQRTRQANKAAEKVKKGEEHNEPPIT